MDSTNERSIKTVQELIKPVLSRYGRNYCDPAICQDILSDINESINSGDIDLMRRFLSADISFWLGTLQFAYFQQYNGLTSHEIYEEWAKIKCRLLISVAKITRDDDCAIQQILNYEDFYTEVFPYSFGPNFIVNFYELRGLDFFLYHYLGSETTAHEDPVMFDHAEYIQLSLIKLGRNIEAKKLSQQLNARKNKLLKIQSDFKGLEYDPSSNLSDRIRIAGERFWSNYLSPRVLNNLEPQSQKELIDEFVTEYLLNQQILSNWSSLTMVLCKIVEREMGNILFSPWKQEILKAQWKPPISKSKKEEKRIESRFITFKTLQSCAAPNGHPPTLGQQYFIAKYWNDILMNNSTQLFSDINIRMANFSKTFRDQIRSLAILIEKPLTQEGQTMTIVDIRNHSVHPRENKNVNWSSFIHQFKKILGKPPVEMLKLITELLEIIKSSSNFN